MTFELKGSDRSSAVAALMLVCGIPHPGISPLDDSDRSRKSKQGSQNNEQIAINNVRINVITIGLDARDHNRFETAKPPTELDSITAAWDSNF